MSTSAHEYRIRLATALPARFEAWFPNLTCRNEATDIGAVVVEGPVADACQLAGIVAAICHRDGEILSVERVDLSPQPRH